MNAVVTIVFANSRKIVEVNFNDSWLEIVNYRHHGDATNVLFLHAFLVWNFSDIRVDINSFYFLLDHVFTFTPDVRLRRDLI